MQGTHFGAYVELLTEGCGHALDIIQKWTIHDYLRTEFLTAGRLQDGLHNVSSAEQLFGKQDDFEVRSSTTTIGECCLCYEGSGRISIVFVSLRLRSVHIFLLS